MLTSSSKTYRFLYLLVLESPIVVVGDTCGGQVAVVVSGLPLAL